MTDKAETEAAIELARELFAGLGQIAIRKMFGGAGIYAGGLFFAIIFQGEIYLRADEEFAAELAPEGSVQFTWQDSKSGKEMRMGYWRIPDYAIDNADTAQALAKRSLRLAAQAGPSKRKKQSSPAV